MLAISTRRAPDEHPETVGGLFEIGAGRSDEFELALFLDGHVNTFRKEYVMKNLTQWLTLE